MSHIRNVNIAAQDSPSIDAFARLRVSGITTLFDSKQIYDNAPLFWDDSEVSGSGTGSTHSTNTASSTMTVGTAAGKRIRQTFMCFNYQPGKSQLIFMTGTLGAVGGGSGITRSMGIFNDDNGIFFRDNEGTLEAVIRSSYTGSAVDSAVAQSAWNLDKLDGTGASGVTLDPAKSQITVTDFEWLGVGRVRMGFVVDGIPVYCHEFLHANNESGVYMSTPNLPLRYEIENDGTGIASALEHICSSVMSEGDPNDLGITRYGGTDGAHVDCATENILYAILGIKLKSTHVSETIKLLSTTMAEHTGSKDYKWKLLFNPTVAGTFTYSNVSNSAIMLARGATANTVTGGTSTGGGMLSSTLKGGAAGAEIDSALRLGAAIDGTVDEIVLCCKPVGGSSNIDIEATMTWRELQ